MSVHSNWTTATYSTNTSNFIGVPWTDPDNTIVARECTTTLTALHSSRVAGGTSSPAAKCTPVRDLAIVATVAGAGQTAGNRSGSWRRNTTAEDMKVQIVNLLVKPQAFN